MKICCVFNYNPLYRLPIFQAMSERFNCEFYFGDSVFAPLKSFDPADLKGFRKYLHASRCMRAFVWYSSIGSVLKREYTHYIVTGSHEYLGNWIILFYAKLFGKKVIGWGHGPKQKETTFKRRFLRKLFFNSLDHVLLYNNNNIKYLEYLGVERSKISVIHNSLNTPLQTELYNKIHPSDVYTNHFGNNSPVAIFIGRIQNRMKVNYLIEAASILKQRGVNLNVALVGPSIDGENLEELVAERGLSDCVWFYGPCYDEHTTSELLYNADVCVAPGTVGLTAIHSLSYGTPCITHNNPMELGPEFEAIKEGITGTFFEENNVESLANAIQKWINVSDKKAEIRENSRREVLENWSIESQMKTIQKMMESL